MVDGSGPNRPEAKTALKRCCIILNTSFQTVWLVCLLPGDEVVNSRGKYPTHLPSAYIRSRVWEKKKQNPTSTTKAYYRRGYTWWGMVRTGYRGTPVYYSKHLLPPMALSASSMVQGRSFGWAGDKIAEQPACSEQTVLSASGVERFWQCQGDHILGYE